MSSFHKPVHRPGDVLELLGGGGDPAETGGLAQDTAAALLHHVRAAQNPEMVDRVIAFADADGIDDLAELWAASPDTSLPGALWRLYLLRHTVREEPTAAAYRFRTGITADTVGQAIAGSGDAPSPDEVVALATTILRGAFTGDFAGALDRAAAFARVMGIGCRELAAGDTDHNRAADEERRATSYAAIAGELTGAASLWRHDALH
ncbi:MAG TPA: hypothetical protein PKE40_01690 [Arachnia sp.]|nr:hypothetical protein [Arachnia sp.]HMT85041.1 hypothetical protein [Arachnia sp.]